MSTSLILTNLFNQKKINENRIPIPTHQEMLASNYLSRHHSETPVDVKPSSWRTFDFGEYIALIKSYEFNNYDHFLYFINEVLIESNRVDHSPKPVIEHMSVDVELYTHDINDVTESDLTLSKTIDEIYDDIYFIE